MLDVAAEGGVSERRAPDDEPELEEETPVMSSGVKTGIAMALGTVLGILLSSIGTGLQAASLRAYQRQADSLESIAATMRLGCTAEPKRTPVVPIEETFY